MKKVFLFLTAGTALVLTAIYAPISKDSDKETSNPFKYPAPTTIHQHMENEKEMNDWRAGYWEYIHSHGEETVDWMAINEANFSIWMERRQQLTNSKTVESYANNFLQAEWIERGSNDQAGNVRATAFDKVSESIYAIGDGGILFKSDINGSNWQSLNDHFVLSRDILLSIRKPDNAVRLISTKGHGVYYSDDEGLNWTASTGFGPSTIYGNGIDLVQLNDADSTLVYVYTFADGFNAPKNKIAYSKDHGSSFTYLTDLLSDNDEYASMSWIDGFSVSYIFDENDVLYQFEDDHINTISSGLSLGGSNTSQLELSCDGTDTVLYVLMDDMSLYRSNDAGSNFNYVSDLPTPAWSCGIGVSFDNPDAIYYGEMELYRSDDGGANFTKVNEWYDYYDDVTIYIHADIMNIETYKKSNGTEFTLIPNHGGLNISYDELSTVPNIGLMDLNVGQFYDVATSPVNSAYIFGGTQDQGFLRTGQGTVAGSVGFEQVISGDYGHQQFTNSGLSIWTQYPGGEFSYYGDAIGASWADYWESIDGLDLPNYGWIVPTAPAPDPADDYILIGGGDLNGGSGSYLIVMENNGGAANTWQFPHDFSSLSSGGLISAIETTPLDENAWYLATENGKFFYSTDAGVNWTMSAPFTGPQNYWIYSTDIYASRLTPGLVFYGGRTYSGSAVYKSEDGGATFTAINNGLPTTMVHEMCMDPGENYLYAATDAGPYVYSVYQNQWFPISGTDAPIQEYISCEYVAADNLVRFATYGRGIWDFKIVEDISGTKELPQSEKFNIYPNPSDGHTTIYSPLFAKVKIFNLQGQEVLNMSLLPGNNNLNISFLKSGQYFLVGMDEGGKVIKEQLIIRK
ncbi:MAG: T9SS type A sorting domain-containing protein [Crocinitomicaceae bacterium]